MNWIICLFKCHKIRRNEEKTINGARVSDKVTAIHSVCERCKKDFGWQIINK